MFDQLVKWCLTQNIQLIHLGGGLKENDSLAKFKSRISNQTHRYIFGTRVNHLPTYQNICQQICQAHQLTPDQLEQETNFPIYLKYINHK
jgi:hypothetical protein